MGEFLDRWLPEMKAEAQARKQGGLAPISQTLSRLAPAATLPKSTAKVSDAPEWAPEYKCGVCHDSHFVHPLDDDGKPIFTRSVSCQCMRAEAERRRQENLLRYCELPVKAQAMTFENFKLTPNLREAYDACLALAERRSTSWIALVGDAGRGKTHLACAVCHRWLQGGKPAKYAYVPLLMKELKDGFTSEGEDSYKSRYNTFLNVPLLAMDDLGTENRTPWVQEHLDTIFDYRLMHELPTVVTTNCRFDDIPFRIASRLKRGGDIIFVDGPEFKYGTAK